MVKNEVNNTALKTERLQPEFRDAALAFITHIFSEEQNIPVELIPLQTNLQHWWCVRDDTMILGTAVAWKTNSGWHWGRFALDKRIRGRGLGKKLAILSFKELFTTEVETLEINARDVTIAILLGLGARITGEKRYFYGHPITPMEMHKNDFLNTLK